MNTFTFRASKKVKTYEKSNFWKTKQIAKSQKINFAGKKSKKQPQLGLFLHCSKTTNYKLQIPQPFLHRSSTIGVYWRQAQQHKLILVFWLVDALFICTVYIYRIWTMDIHMHIYIYLCCTESLVKNPAQCGHFVVILQFEIYWWSDMEGPRQIQYYFSD